MALPLEKGILTKEGNSSAGSYIALMNRIKASPEVV